MKKKQHPPGNSWVREKFSFTYLKANFPEWKVSDASPCRDPALSTVEFDFWTTTSPTTLVQNPEHKLHFSTFGRRFWITSHCDPTITQHSQFSTNLTLLCSENSNFLFSTFLLLKICNMLVML